MTQKKIIVYTVSDDYEKIRDIEKDLWANKKFHFDNTSVELAPNPKPGYRGLWILSLTDPSEAIVKDIRPSYVSTGKYPQFESYTDDDITEMIKMMVYTQKRDVRDIAKTLKVSVGDILVWSYYAKY